MITKTTLIIVYLISGLIGFGQNLYVSTTGDNNSGDGSFNNPYKTITKAAQQATPGTTVYVRGGTYQNPNYGNNDIWKQENPVIISGVHCAENMYITFMPYNAETVIVKFDGTYGFQIANSSYIKIIGFEVINRDFSIR